ncbi:uncharacterized protein METZ01_LOCUS285203, partial [marine metagenome]
PSRKMLRPIRPNPNKAIFILLL